MSDPWDKVKNGDKITLEDIKDTSDEGLVMVTESSDIPSMDDGLQSISYSIDDEDGEAL